MDIANSGPLGFAAGNSEATYAVWVKTTTGTGGIISASCSCNGYYRIALDLTGGKPVFSFREFNNYAGTVGSAAGGQAVNNGQWHHIAATRDAGHRVRVYVDGILTGSGTDAVTTPILIDRAAVGTNLMTWRRIAGNVDDVRIYSLALTEEQIAALASGSQ